MIIALFGVTCVGKTTIGRIIAEMLGYEFYDLDDEIKSYYNDTLTNIYRYCITRHEMDTKKAVVLQKILSECGDKAVIAISPIYYSRLYKSMLTQGNVFAIVLEDSPENIADRMIDTDENDVLIENPEKDWKQDLADARYFISRYKNSFSKIQCNYHISGKSASEAANDMIMHILSISESEKHGIV